MQRAPPPVSGTAQTEPAAQSVWRVQLPPGGTHSRIPSPQRSVQLHPLVQSAAEAHGPNA